LFGTENLSYVGWGEDNRVERGKLWLAVPKHLNNRRSILTAARRALKGMTK
jgi:hypothetical protein